MRFFCSGLYNSLSLLDDPFLCDLIILHQIIQYFYIDVMLHSMLPAAAALTQPIVLIFWQSNNKLSLRILVWNTLLKLAMTSINNHFGITSKIFVIIREGT